jgi:trimeric autotransporter adhesin
MSTKTTFKRIALVAVAALGFGMISVAPSTAVQPQTAAAISIGSSSMKTGVFNYVPVSIQLPTTYAAGDTVTVNAQITAAPTTGGNANAASVLGSGSADDSNVDGARFQWFTDAVGTSATELAVTTLNAAHVVGAYKEMAGQLGVGIDSGVAAGKVSAASMHVLTSSSNTTAGGLLTVYLGVKPDLAGSYGVLVSTNAGVRTYYSAGDTRATATLTTTGSVASVALSMKNTSPIGDTTGYGVLFSATLKDSAALATNLGALDTVTFTSNNAGDTFFQCDNAGCTTALTGGVASQAMFVNGVGYFKVQAAAATADQTSTITATTDIVGGTASSTTASASFKNLSDLGAIADNTLVQGLGSTTAGYDGTPSQSASWNMYRASTATTSAVKYTLPAAAAAAGAFAVLITDTSKAILGSGTKAAQTWHQVCSFAAAATSCSVTTTHAALGNGVSTYSATAPEASATVLGIGATAAVVTVNGATPTAGTNVVTATPAGPIAAVTGGTISLSANVVDRFGSAIANAAVVVTVAGRNTVAATTKLSDADGNVTFSYTDAGTISANDVVTFSYTAVSTAATDSVTVSFGGADVSTVSVTSPNTTLGVATATTTVSPISAGDGAEAGAVAITATIKDASGNLLVGVPVTWTVSGTTALIPSAEVTTYSSATGVATSSVYAWVAGAYTVTATAGGKTGDGAITFGSTTPANARVLSAKVEGNVVTATVVDRFGNPVKGVTVYAVKTGAGYFGAGLAKTSDTTLADGTASFGITGGDASVTVTTLDPAAAAGTNAFGQTCALAGNLTCASGATAAVAFTASVAGTALVSETYTGASFAPAGVSSVTVQVTDGASAAANAAADAAAEAIDAANAATDAANLAAEAADAATVAAEEARDAADAATTAVEELATQVATLMAALKAQITTLANTVAKIAKKVKA